MVFIAEVHIQRFPSHQSNPSRSHFKAFKPVYTEAFKPVAVYGRVDHGRPRQSQVQPGTVLKRPIIFKKQALWGCQIWYWEEVTRRPLGDILCRQVVFLLKDHKGTTWGPHASLTSFFVKWRLEWVGFTTVSKNRIFPIKLITALQKPERQSFYFIAARN